MSLRVEEHPAVPAGLERRAVAPPTERKYKFSGHQTFAFRYGWLEKGVRAVAKFPDLFWREDALTLLGVGKNMVESIRHWCEIAQLIEVVPGAARELPRQLRPSPIARYLLEGDQARDSFLEDDASLWLVHWLLVTNPTTGTAWQLLFSHYNRPDFSRREVIGHILDFASKKNLRVADSVVARDVDCLIRTYVPSPASKKKPLPEETFDCPLQQLNLIHPSPDGELYRFAIGPKPSLPAAVFAFALHQQFQRRQSQYESMSIQESLYAEGSPGQVFKLDENSLIEYVEELEDHFAGSIVLDETAGLKQIFRKRAFDPITALDDYYLGDWRR